MPGSSWPVHELAAAQRQELELRLKEHKPEITSSELDELVQELEIATGCYVTDRACKEAETAPAVVRKALKKVAACLERLQKALRAEDSNLLIDETLWNDPGLRAGYFQKQSELDDGRTLFGLLNNKAAVEVLLMAIEAAGQGTRRQLLVGDTQAKAQELAEKGQSDQEIAKALDELPDPPQQGRPIDYPQKGFALLVGRALEESGFDLSETRAKKDVASSRDSACVGVLKVLLESVGELTDSAHNLARSALGQYDTYTWSLLGWTACYRRLVFHFDAKVGILPPPPPADDENQP